MRPALGAALFGVVILLCAATFDTQSLYVPGVALTVLGAGSAAWVGLAGWGARIERTLGAPVVQEEEPYPIRLTARTGLLPSPGGELIEPLVDRRLPMAARRRRVVYIHVRFARRGRRVLAPSRLLVRDPLGLAVRERCSEAGEVLVLPRVEPVVVGADGGTDGGVDRGRLAAAAAATELDSLRPYRTGTPASRIHWATAARGREIMERRLVADEDLQPLVVLDPRRPDSRDALDSAVRAAASLVVHLAREGGCGVLLPGDRRATTVAPDLRAWAAIHTRLALVEAGASAPALSRVGRGGAVFWVTAHGGRAPAGLQRAAAATRYLVTPSPEGASQPVFTVAGCAGYRLGHRRERAAA